MSESKLDYWQPLISEWRSSKLSRVKFCEQHNINPHTMAYWQEKLEKPKTTAKFINVKQASLELVVGDNLRLSVPTGTDPKWLSECIKYLK